MATTLSEESAMDRTVIRLNIERFRHHLGQETDEAKRKLIVLLLAEEEAKLAASTESEGSSSRGVANDSFSAWYAGPK